MLQFWPSVRVNAIFLEMQPLQMYLLINYDATIRMGPDPNAGVLVRRREAQTHRGSEQSAAAAIGGTPGLPANPPN